MVAQPPRLTKADIWRTSGHVCCRWGSLPGSIVPFARVPEDPP